MDPQQLAARQAMMAQLAGGQPQAPVQEPQPAPMPQQEPAGEPKRTASPDEKLAKAVMEGTAHQDPHIQALAKVLLEKLIPYLGPSPESSGPR